MGSVDIAAQAPLLRYLLVGMHACMQNHFLVFFQFLLVTNVIVHSKVQMVGRRYVHGNLVEAAIMITNTTRRGKHVTTKY